MLVTLLGMITLVNLGVIRKRPLPNAHNAVGNGDTRIKPVHLSKRTNSPMLVTLFGNGHAG